MASILPIFFVLVIVAGLMACGWLFTPKGQHQTYAFETEPLLRTAGLTDLTILTSLIRSSILLAITCCYLMWTVTYLAQLHPLIGTCSIVGIELLNEWS